VRGSELANDHAADRVAGAEGADDAQTAGRQIILELVEGNDGAGGTGIGVLIQHHRRLLLQVRITSQQLAGNQHVHVQVGLVQPEWADVVYRNVRLLKLLGDQLGHYGADLAEHLAPFRDKELVRLADTRLIGTVEKAEVVTDIVGELGQQPGAQNLV